MFHPVDTTGGYHGDGNIITPGKLMLTFHINIYIYENMKTASNILKSISDEQRLRILLLLSNKELSVCQLMGIIEKSQPLISRNLSILSGAGFLEERKEGKLKFFRIKEDIAPKQRAILETLKRISRNDQQYKEDLKVLKQCQKFQKKIGKCNMETFYKFREWRNKKE
jgi:ArsR family transcriptional regulator